MSTEPIQDILNSIGALAEISAIMYKQLIANGVPANHACKLTSSYIQATLKSNQGGTNYAE